jgi:hypothetical protein
MPPDTPPSDQVPQEVDQVKPEEKIMASYQWAKGKIKQQQFKSTISNYKKGLKWDEERLNEPLEEVESEHPQDKTIDIKEKPFRIRFSLFLVRSIIPALGLSIAMTAPITFPWLFEFVIPDIIAIIPPFLADMIRDMINYIHSLLAIFSWLEPIINFLMQIAATFNPFLIYMAVMYILNSTEIVQNEHYEDPLADLSNIPSAVDFFASDFQAKFNLGFTEIAVFLFVISFFISLFLVIRGEKEIIYEFLTTKDQENHLEKVEEVFIGYYKEKGYQKVNYIKNRFSESPKLIYCAYVMKLSPIISLIIPVAFAVFFLAL